MPGELRVEMMTRRGGLVELCRAVAARPRPDRRLRQAKDACRVDLGPLTKFGAVGGLCPGATGRCFRIRRGHAKSEGANQI